MKDIGDVTDIGFENFVMKRSVTAPQKAGLKYPEVHPHLHIMARNTAKFQNNPMKNAVGVGDKSFENRNSR